MNLFYLDRSPYLAGKYHCNKHVCKLLVELAQMLSTAHRILDDNDNPALYKITHKNHPTSVWVRSSLRAYTYTFHLFDALCGEYTKRYNKMHATESRLLCILAIAPKNIPDLPWVDPPQCMPEECKREDTVKAYRYYYVKEKANFAKWPEGETPKWFYEEYDGN